MVGIITSWFGLKYGRAFGIAGDVGKADGQTHQDHDAGCGSNDGTGAGSDRGFMGTPVCGEDHALSA